MNKNLMQFRAPINFSADSSDSAAEPKPAKFDILAYNGGALQLNSWDMPVVIDLAGLTFPDDNNITVIIDHNYVPGAVAGNTTAITNDGKKLKVAGILYNTCDEFVAKLVEKSKMGMKWEASIGARPVTKETVAAGKTVSVNGQTIHGPVIIARKAQLIECSVVVFGADPNTVVNIAAARNADGANHIPPKTTIILI